jgi:anti-anti-sigma factor
MTDLVTLSVRKESPGTVVVTAVGEIDLSNARQLETVLDGVHDADRVVVDLILCAFFDSSCLAVLARHAHAARDEGKHFSVRVSDQGRQIVAITNLSELLNLYPAASTAPDEP